MKIRTSVLASPALDWAVAQAVGLTDLTNWSPSTNWAQCGPLMEQIKCSVAHYNDGWAATPLHKPPQDGHYGTDYSKFDSSTEPPTRLRINTPLIAICRVIAEMQFGKVVDVPDEFCKQDNYPYCSAGDRQ